MASRVISPLVNTRDNFLREHEDHQSSESAEQLTRNIRVVQKIDRVCSGMCNWNCGDKYLYSATL